MALSTTTTSINFLVPDLHDQYTLGIADASYYAPNFAITNPTLEITPPSFAKATIPYNTGNLNVINSNDLNITCVSDGAQLAILPDGIWTIKMSVSSPNTYFKTKSFMRTSNIRRKFGIAVMKTDAACCGGDIQSQQQKYLDEAFYYIELATAAGNDCNAVVAISLLQQANKLLDNFIDNKANYYLNPGYYLAGY
jgi:hypothetical protein